LGSYGFKEAFDPGYTLAGPTTRTVTNVADPGLGSLRDTAAEASSGDVIVFAGSGEIDLTSGEIVIDNKLTITGPGASSPVTNSAKPTENPARKLAHHHLHRIRRRASLRRESRRSRCL
jgi:hypothetical protein